MSRVKKFIKTAIRNLRYRNAPPIGCKTVREHFTENKSEHNSYKELSPEHKICRNPPRTLDPQVHWKFVTEYSHLSPATFVSRIQYGRVYEDGIVITPDNYVLKDVSLTFRDPSQEHWVCHSGNMPPIVKIDKSIAVISSASANQYFHWMFDILPRFKLIEEYSTDFFYINSDKKFHQEYLELLGISTDRILSPKKDLYIQAKELLLPSLPGSTGNATQETCSFLKGFLSYTHSLKKEKRIYLSREDATSRRVLNEDEVFPIFEKYGFEKFTLTGMPVLEQIELFASAQAVAGPHGSGFSNLVFCMPGTKVIELFSPAYINVCFWSLSEQCQLEYYYLLGEHEIKYADYLDPHPSNENVYINTEKLSRLIDSLLEDNILN